MSRCASAAFMLESAFIRFRMSCETLVASLDLNVVNSDRMVFRVRVRSFGRCLSSRTSRSMNSGSSYSTRFMIMVTIIMSVTSVLSVCFMLRCLS